MKKFLLWLVLVIAGVFLTLIGGALILVNSFGEKPVVIQPNTVLELQLSGALTEYALPPIEEVMNKSVTAHSIVRSIDAASSDERVSALCLKVGVLRNQFGPLKEIRDAIVRFRASGKPVYAHFSMTTDPGLYIASAADSIWMTPAKSGGLFLRGLGTQIAYYRDLFKKLGVEFKVLHEGKYKGAYENYARKAMSDEMRESLGEVLNDLTRNYLNTIARARGVELPVLEGLLQKRDQLMIDFATAADLGLVDAGRYPDAIRRQMRKLFGEPEFMKLSVYGSAVGEPLALESVAVVYLEGPINFAAPNRSIADGPTITPSLVAGVVEEIMENDRIKSAVIRINSPGGSALASEEIWHTLELLNEKMPVTISMSSVAASGGYYIAAAGDHIFVEPNTITGSIGVVGMLVDARGLLGKLDVNYETVETSPYSHFGHPAFKMSHSDEMLLERSFAMVYEEFKTRVSQGRDLTMAQVEEVAQGRIWSGVDAVTIGLADNVGTLPDAITHAAVEGGLVEGEYGVRYYPRKKDMVELVMEAIGRTTSSLDVLAWFEEQATAPVDPGGFNQLVMPVVVE